MRINTKFPMAIHILTLIAMNHNPDMPSTSQLIAKSIGTNPVVVRRIISQLRQAGLLQTRPGVAGAEFLKEPEDITLLDIYKAVQEDEDRGVFDLHQNPSQICPIGRNIHSALAAPLGSAQLSLERDLAAHTLKDIIMDIESNLK
ncbi:MAG: Rrf2 family transcriptional regulator [Bacillota bacterium]|nr:Rrf2 family transcriptional regulator [Bacillota bacterium]